jgi:hypothetical protein
VKFSLIKVKASLKGRSLLLGLAELIHNKHHGIINSIVDDLADERMHFAPGD